jgi:hypothetical protein
VRCRIWPGTWWIGNAMTAAELIARLSELDPGTVVIVTDPVQWLSCHMELADVGPWAVSACHFVPEDCGTVAPGRMDAGHRY